MLIRAFRIADEDAVVRLWERCDLVRPWNDPRQDIARKMQVRPDLFLVATDDASSATNEVESHVVGTVMAGYEGHRGWINYLAVAPEARRQGLGRALMAEAERLLRAAGCPKINLQVRTTNATANAFYAALGFAQDEVVSFGKRLVSDTP